MVTNIVISKKPDLKVNVNGYVFLYRESQTKPRTVSCRTPATTRAQSDLTPFTTTLCCKKHKKHLSIPMSFHLFHNYTICFKKFVRRGVKSFFKVQNKSVNLTLIVHDFAQSFILVFSCVLQLCNFLNACCFVRQTHDI